MALFGKMSIAIRAIIAVVLLVAWIYWARLLDRKWRASHPEEKPFAWGYFQALCFFPGGLLWFIVPFVSREPAWAEALYISVYGVIGSYAGYALIKEKKKWAWIFVVAAQLNLITWLINIVYGSSRWKEFR